VVTSKSYDLLFERNLARDVVLFNPPPKLERKGAREWKRVTEEERQEAEKEGKCVRFVKDLFDGKAVPAVEEIIPVVGYVDRDRAIYFPTEFAELFRDMPFARVVLAGLITLFLRNEDWSGLYERKTDGGERLVMARVDTTLGEICRTVGLPPSGPNKMRIKQALQALHLVRFKNVEFFTLEVEEKVGRKKVRKLEARRETHTTLLAYLEFREAVVDGKRQETTVTAFICPPFTAALVLDTPKARIPLAALRATYGHTRATREMQNLLFYLAAVSPEKKGLPLQFREETLLEVMRLQDSKRCKNVRRLEKALNVLKKSRSC